ncbi:hypothetical protein ID11_20880 (plasmid) [Pantoea vagans]|nr:hypothetical protein ID11_20880 [Pantoea vagans]
MVTAFNRDGRQRINVFHRLFLVGNHVSLLVQQSAWLFVLRCRQDKDARINVMLIIHRASDIL